jgi:hypothetical protein
MCAALNGNVSSASATARPQPCCLEGPLGELVALLIHDHPIHHVGVPQGLGTHQEGHIVCVPSDSSQSPALQLQAVDDAVLLLCPPSWMVSYKENKIMFSFHLRLSE